jgi:hypothetical protein
MDEAKLLIEEVPRSEWGRVIIESCCNPDRLELLADNLSVVCAEVSAYAGLLSMSCGIDEIDARRAAAAKRKAVRRALGYSYP